MTVAVQAPHRALDRLAEQLQRRRRHDLRHLHCRLHRIPCFTARSNVTRCPILSALILHGLQVIRDSWLCAAHWLVLVDKFMLIMPAWYSL